MWNWYFPAAFCYRYCNCPFCLLDSPIACANDIVTEFYQPVGLDDHATVLVDEKVYLWAGRRKDEKFPLGYSSEDKLQATCYVDVFHCRLGM